MSLPLLPKTAEEYPAKSGERPHAIISSGTQRKDTVQEVLNIGENEAESQVRDNNPTRGVTSSSSKIKRIRNVYVLSDREGCEERAENLAEESDEQPGNLTKEIYKTKGAYRGAELKFFRPRRNGNLEKGSISGPSTLQLETRNTSSIVWDPSASHRPLSASHATSANDHAQVRWCFQHHNGLPATSAGLPLLRCKKNLLQTTGFTVTEN